MNSHFATRDYSLWYPTGHKRLGRQNLTALCTATSQNLAAVGSSHSLTETVNLGPMTTAGLIGTLHLCTPPVKSHMLNSHKTAATHNI